MAPADHPPLFDPPVQPLTHDESMSFLPWLPQDDMDPETRRRLLAHLDLCGICRRELLYLSELRAALDTSAAEENPSPTKPALDVDSSLESVMQRIDLFQAESGGPSSQESAREKQKAQAARSRWTGWSLAATLALAVLGGIVLRSFFVDGTVLTSRVPTSRVPGTSSESVPGTYPGSSKPVPGTYPGSSKPVPSKPVPGTYPGSVPGTSSEPVPGTYSTLSDGPTEPAVSSSAGSLPMLALGFQPDTPIAKIHEILRAVDAEIVGGPSALGILTVAPIVSTSRATNPASKSDFLDRGLAVLRAQPEVTFAEPKSTVLQP